MRIGAAILSLGLVGGWAWMQQPDPDLIAHLSAAGPQWAENFKETRWPEICDEQAAVLQKPFAELSRLVGGSGFVAKDGKAVFRWGNDHNPQYVASAMKPFLSALLLLAVEQGLVASLDSQVAEVVPELKTLNQGIDAGITWRQLATMTSGYGLQEAPGQAFAYNDFAVQLFYDALIHGVFGECGDEVLLRELAGPLGFEDRVTFRGFGAHGPEPKMRASARDLARFGQWLLDGKIPVDGSDRGRLPATVREQLTSLVLDESIPMTSANPAEMLLGQQSVGGGQANLLSMGPGRYGYHLWHNRKVAGGTSKVPDAPEDSFLAVGKRGESVLWVIPSWQMVVAWTNSEVTDQETAKHDPDAVFNQVARRLAAVVAVP